MKGRNLVIGLLLALGIGVGVIFWLGATGGGRGSESGLALSSGGAHARTQSDPSATSGVPGWDGAAIERTIADRRVRDELRRRILEGWAKGDGETATAAREGRLPSMPTTEEGEIDPKYIQSVFREDMMPMAKKCYEELLSRKPDAGGLVEMWFKIVGDDKLGGIIEEAEIDGGVAGAMGDEKLKTCMTESLLSLSFRPPPNDGFVTVGYPIMFSPEDDAR